VSSATATTDCTEPPILGVEEERITNRSTTTDDKSADGASRRGKEHTPAAKTSTWKTRNYSRIHHHLRIVEYISIVVLK
jgi:hypothetical protein